MVDQLLEWFPELWHRVLVLWWPWEDQAKDVLRVVGKPASAGSRRRLWEKRIGPRFGPDSDLHRDGAETGTVDPLWP